MKKKRNGGELLEGKGELILGGGKRRGEEGSDMAKG